MSFLSRIFGGKTDRESCLPLYRSVVETARMSFWYRDGQVPDTVDGRFDMIAAILALVLIRLEREGNRANTASVLLAELFVEDMDGSLRQIGIGDLVVGKHIGRMMGAVGGRLAAFRSAIETGADFNAAVRRNIFHDAPPSDSAVAFVAERLGAFNDRIAATPFDDLLTGELPRP